MYHSVRIGLTGAETNEGLHMWAERRGDMLTGTEEWKPNAARSGHVESWRVGKLDGIRDVGLV